MVSECRFDGVSLSSLFVLKWPSLTHLDFKDCHLDMNDITNLSHKIQAKSYLLSELSTLRLRFGELGTKDSDMAMNALFQRPVMNLTQVILNDITVDFYKKFTVFLSSGKLQTIRLLGLPIKGSENLEEFPNAASVPSLMNLMLTKIQWSDSDLEQFSDTEIVNQLCRLDISRSSEITGNLPFY